MYEGFKNTFASATMPMRVVVGSYRGARKRIITWGKLVAILDAVPARKFVVVMVTGPEGMESGRSRNVLFRIHNQSAIRWLIRDSIEGNLIGF